MAKKKISPLDEAKLKFDETGLPEDELVYLRLLAEEKAEAAPQVKNETLGLADAIIKAVNKHSKPLSRPTKQYLDKLIKCDEVILERSEKDPSKLTLVETIREGVPMSEKNLIKYNQSILTQTRAKVLIPQENKEKFIAAISKRIKDETKKD